MNRAARLVTLPLLLAGALASAPAARAAEGSRMSGRVVDADTQAPIADAEIELANTGGGQGFHRAKTNGRGEFAIEGIASDRWYSLTAWAPGYADFVIGSWQFPAAQRAVDLVIPLDRAGVLELRATRRDGRTPVAGARVRIVNERGANWWEGYRPPPEPRFTDTKGVARFEGLTAGTWTVNVDAAGLLAAELRRVAVTRGRTTSLPIPLGRPASLSGAVRLADGTGVAGVTVTARGPGEGVGTTDADGLYTIGDLAPGRWRVEVAHEGFRPAAARERISLAEGESRDGADVVVTPRDPELAFVLGREAFLPDAPVKLVLRSFRVGALELAVYALPAERLLDPARDFRALATGSAEGDTAGLTRVASVTHEAPAGPEWSWREEEIELPGRLAPGAYLLRGRAGALERRALFFVTALGLIVKRSADGLLVSAGSLVDGGPVAGARVHVIRPDAGPGRAPDGTTPDWALALGGAGRPAGVTDALGLARVSSVGTAARVRVVAVSAAHGVSVVDAPLAPAAEQGGDKAFLYTDRPLYRPGQTVHWKLFVRRAAGDGYALPDATVAALRFGAPDGSSLDARGGALSARGTADGAIALPAEAPLGDWTLQATAGRATAFATVGVQEYRKPEFQVEVTPDRPVYVNGDEVRFRIAAAYFFGAPVFGATVRYNLFESRIARGVEEDDADFESGPVGYGRVLKTGETRTDLDGRATVAFTPERVSYDRRLTLEVEVVDPSSRVVSGRGAAVMGRGLFAIGLKPLARVLEAGEPIVVEVSTRDHAGKPVSAAVAVELDQESWNPIERRYTRASRPLASTSATTDREGRARVSLTPGYARSGPITIRARAEDSKGNRIAAEASVWVYDARLANYAYRYSGLEAIADRATYAPGDTAFVLVNTDARGGVLLASVEGREVYEARAVALEGRTTMLAFPIRPEYAPNVFVSVLARKGKEVHAQTVELAVEAQRHDLVIGLATDRERYRPGDSARVEVTTRDAEGKPVTAEVSLGVVDESIYALRPDRTPDPHDVFYGRRPNWVTTVVSFPALYFGGADKSAEDRVRRDFRDVALWAPTVATGADGRASVGVRWPDNLTTWRLTSRGATDATLVGDAVSKTLVTKDVVARLAGPRSFVAGDEAALVSIVTNRGDVALPAVEQSLAVEGDARATGPATARAAIAAGGEARATWRVAIPERVEGEAPEARFVFRARARADQDALEVKAPVRPRAVPLGSRGGGRIEGASTEATVALPQDLVRAGSAVTIDVAPSVAALAFSAVEYLGAYPYGCTEQTANGILPAAALVRALRAARVATPPGRPDPAARLGPAVERLGALQNSDGGWGWWREGETDPFLTALALDALAHARLVGVEAASAPLQRALPSLPRWLAAIRTLDGEAYALAHLATLLEVAEAKNSAPWLKEQLESIAAGLAAGRDRLATSGLAMAARGHAALGRDAEAKTLIAALVARARRDASGLSWPADPGFEDAWFGEDFENTAEAASALLAVDARDARATEAVRWLAGRRTGDHWRSTRATGPVATALARYLAARPGEARPRYRLRALWNGEEVLDREIGGADALSAEPIRVRIPGARLRPGDNRLTFAKEGAGEAFHGWEARALVPSPGPPAAAGARLTVTRELLRGERTTDRRGRPRVLASPLANDQPLRVGEAAVVRLTLRATATLRHLVVEDPRTAGFEIDALLPEGSEWPWGTHAEERDDRAVFFLDRLEEGDTVIEYLVRPELAGRFTALPASATGMYAPELAARSGETRITVAPNP